MDELLIGYALDALDEPAQRQVEAYLAQNPKARERLALLEQSLAPLAADEYPVEAPDRLVERTLARVAERICSPHQPDDLPTAPPVSRSSVSSPRTWWRRADVLVAACLILTLLGVGLTILNNMRAPSSAANVALCKNNLRQFHFALQHYHDHYRQFPNVSREAPRDVAGMVVPMLSDAGVLPEGTSVGCPGVGSRLVCSLSVASLRAMSDEDFDKHAPTLSLCYAYSLGYRDNTGMQRGPGDVPPGSWSQLPIMADRPPAEGIIRNSINHSKDGQNVLFADGHVAFLDRRIGGGDDIFLNRENRVGAGLDVNDFVLGYSSARP